MGFLLATRTEKNGKKREDEDSLGREEIARGRPKGGEAGEPGGLMTSFLPGPGCDGLPMAQWAQRLEKRDPLLPSAVWYGPSANGKGSRGVATTCASWRRASEVVEGITDQARIG